MTKQIIFTKLVGFGSDGASVMTGCKSGVSTRLKREQPLLFTLHCMAHRMELGFKRIIGANSFMSTFTELLFGIYNFYHSSALNRENLKSIMCCSRPGHYLTSALKDESSFLGVPLSGKHDAVQLKADMKCLVDGLTAQLEVRLGENGSDEAEVPPKEPEWVDVFKNAQDSCPNVLQLVDLLLSLPASSADCKQGISLTKVVKSDWRTRLRDTMVTDLMTIQLHSPEIADFDPTPSILRCKGS
eukprot:Em0017g584a